MPAPTVDWDKLETEYVTADPPITHAELAEKYGLHPGTIHRRASEREWSQKRELHCENVASKTLAEIEEQQVDWRVQEIERIDNLLGTLAEGQYQLTAKASIKDVDTLVRLKAFLLGEADSRTEHQGFTVIQLGEDDYGGGNSDTDSPATDG